MGKLHFTTLTITHFSLHLLNFKKYQLSPWTNPIAQPLPPEAKIELK